MKTKIIFILIIAFLITGNLIEFFCFQKIKSSEIQTTKEIDIIKSKNMELGEENESLTAQNKLLSNENEFLQSVIKKDNEEKASLEKKIAIMEKEKVQNLPTFKKKIAYLTFDDGPSENTLKILNILKIENIKATFFVNGYGKEYIYKKIVSEGHAIGNHSYSHDYKALYTSVEGFKNDVNRLATFLDKMGIETKLFRFPGGSNNHVSWEYGGKDIMSKLVQLPNEMGYEYFDWNVSSEDATGINVSTSTLIQNIMKEAKTTQNAIVLMHDSESKETTVEALPQIIEVLREMGFKFDVLTESSKSVHFKLP